MKGAWIVGAVALVVLVGCGGGGGGGGDDGDAPVEVTLVEQNGSGQNGTATFNQSGGGTNIVVELVSAVTEGDIQPAGIYEGTCDDVADAEPKYELPDVVQGIGGATIDTPVDTLTASPHAIAVRQSADDDTVVACGEIVRE